MKKAVVTLKIGTGMDAIYDLTRELQEDWSRRIRADYICLTEPTGQPYVTLEKFQVRKLYDEYDFIYFIDCDALVSPAAWDFAEQMPPHHVIFWGYDHNNRWFMDDYFRRDGRNISACTWFVAAPRSVGRDLWTPIEEQDITLDEAVSRINPVLCELTSEVHAKPIGLIDDFIISRNIARFGLKVDKLQNLFKSIGHQGVEYFYHEYLISREKKVENTKAKLCSWHVQVWKDEVLLNPPSNPPTPQTPATS